METLKTVEENTLPEGYRMTELGPLPEEWRVVKLGEVFEEVVERVKDLEYLHANKLPVLSLTKNEGLILQAERFRKRIATEDVDEYKVVRRGQIVYNPYVIWEGAIHILSKFEAGIVSPVYVVLRAKQKIADPYFLDAWLRMPQAIAAYNRFATGAVNRRRAIKKQDFWRICLPLPPLPEQKAIAQVLKSVQEAKEKTEEVIKALKEFKKSLMRHLFTYGPVPVNETDRVETRETEIDPLPAHWKVVRLGEVLTRIQYGLSKRGKKKGSYPIIRMNNIQDGRIVAYPLQYVNLNEEEFAKFRLEKQDILFNRTNSFELVGKTALFELEGDYVFASYLIRLRVFTKYVEPRFLNYLLNWEKTQNRLKRLASRAVSQANISASKLQGFKIPLPPLSEQQQIARILRAVDRRIEAEENRKQALDDLFRSLLHNLMTAKIRLPKEFIDRFAENE